MQYILDGDDDDDDLSSISSTTRSKDTSTTLGFLDVQRRRSWRPFFAEGTESYKAFLLVGKNFRVLIALIVWSVIVGASSVFLKTSDMGSDGWYAIWCVGVVLALLVSNMFQDPGLAFVFGLVLLVVPGTLSVERAVEGFGSKLVFAIAALYVVARGARESTMLNYFVKYALGVTNNTTLVAMLMPVVQSWCKKANIPSRILLMPLSFSAIFGGMLTLIGTSVNLVVSDNADSESADSFHHFKFYEIGYVGLPSCITAALYMILFAPRILGDESRKDKRGTGIDGGQSTIRYTDSHRDLRAQSLGVSSVAAETDATRVLPFTSPPPPLVSPLLDDDDDDAVAEVTATARRKLEEEREVLKQYNIFTTCCKVVRLEENKTIEEFGWLSLSKTLSVLQIQRPCGDDMETDRNHAVATKRESSKSESSSSKSVPLKSPLQNGDIVLFAGSVDDFTNVVYRHDNLIHIETGEKLTRLGVSFHRRKLAVVVVAVNSRLDRKRVKDMRFREFYDAVIIGVHRRGCAINPRGIPDLELRAGDALLVEASSSFFEKFRTSPDFVSIAQVSGDATSILPRSRPFHALVACICVLWVAIGSGTRVLDLAFCCLVAIFVMLGTRTIARDQIWTSISSRTLVVVGAGFGLSKGLIDTGASLAIAKSISSVFGSNGIFLLLTGIFFVTAFLSNVVSPVACVSLMFPIVFEIQEAKEDVHVEKVLGILMIAGSCSIVSPYAYQTNLMVAETAGYTAMDFLKFGGPLLFIIGVQTCLLASFVFWGTDAPLS